MGLRNLEDDRIAAKQRLQDTMEDIFPGRKDITLDAKHVDHTGVKEAEERRKKRVATLIRAPHDLKDK